jgi:hypothetical protein
MVLTSGPGLPVGERRKRERGGAADRWGWAVRRARRHEQPGRLGRGRRGGEAGAGAVWAGYGPAEGGWFFSFSVFFFYFLFLFISFSFESTIC